jgi:hypothetical protein
MISCEIVVQMQVSIPAKFYCFMATSFLTAYIQSCQRTCFLAQVFLEKTSITSALIEIWSSFYPLFNVNKMPFPVNLLHQYIQHSYVLKVFEFDLLFLEMQYFN